MSNVCSDLEKHIFDTAPSDRTYRSRVSSALCARGITKYISEGKGEYKEPVAADMIIAMDEVLNG